MQLHRPQAGVRRLPLAWSTGPSIKDSQLKGGRLLRVARGPWGQPGLSGEIGGYANLPGPWDLDDGTNEAFDDGCTAHRPLPYVLRTECVQSALPAALRTRASFMHAR